MDIYFHISRNLWHILPRKSEKIVTNSGWIQNLHYFSDLLCLVIEEEDHDFLEFEMADPKYANLPGIVS